MRARNAHDQVNILCPSGRTQNRTSQRPRISPLLYICAMTPKTKKRDKRNQNENAKTKKVSMQKKINKMDKARKSLLYISALRHITEENRLLVLERQMYHTNATQGTLLVNNETFDTIELPWKNNQINISCIPTGTYTYQRIQRQSNKEPALWLRNVKDRTEILIHYGTKPQHSKGCILLPQMKKFLTLVNNKGLIVIL